MQSTTKHLSECDREHLQKLMKFLSIGHLRNIRNFHNHFSLAQLL